MHEEPAFVALGFRENARGGWWFRAAQQRLHPSDLCRQEGKNAEDGMLGIAHGAPRLQLGEESLPVTGGCRVSSVPRGGRH